MCSHLEKGKNETLRRGPSLSGFGDLKKGEMTADVENITERTQEDAHVSIPAAVIPIASPELVPTGANGAVACPELLPTGANGAETLAAKISLFRTQVSALMGASWRTDTGITWHGL
jgi:hypothetical protein